MGQNVRHGSRHLSSQEIHFSKRSNSVYFVPLNLSTRSFDSNGHRSAKLRARKNSNNLASLLSFFTEKVVFFFFCLDIPGVVMRDKNH